MQKVSGKAKQEIENLYDMLNDKSILNFFLPEKELLGRTSLKKQHCGEAFMSIW